MKYRGLDTYLFDEAWIEHLRECHMHQAWEEYIEAKPNPWNKKTRESNNITITRRTKRKKE